MRNDIITATLPVDPVEAKFTALVKHWGPFEVVRAAHDNGAPLDCDLWGLPLLIAVEEQLTQEAAQAANMRMLDADAPKPAAPAPAAEDPLAEVHECINELVEFASEDAINSGSALPGGRGCIGPDISGMEMHVDAVIRAVRKLLGQPEAQSPATSDEITLPDWLLVEHKPGARVKGGSL